MRAARHQPPAAGFILSGPLLYLVIAAIVAVALAAITMKISNYLDTVKEAGRVEVRLQWEQAGAARRAREAAQAAAAATTLENRNEKARIVYRTITERVDHYIDRPVYRNVCFDADGLRDANAALRGDAAPVPDPAQPHRPLPGPRPALRWDRSLRLAQTDRGG